MDNDKPRIPVVCLCGTYLKASQETIGKIKICPSCHGTVEIRPSDIADGRFSTLFLKARRIPGKGKARWKLTDEFEVRYEALRSGAGKDFGAKAPFGNS